MFTGEKINTTEDRAVLHVALRNRSNRPILVDGKDVMPEVNAVLEHMREFTEAVRSGAWTGLHRQADHRRRQHRHRRLATSGPVMVDRGAASPYRASADLHASTSSPTSTARTSPRRCKRLHPETHPLHRRQQDVHHPGDDHQRHHRQGVVPQDRRRRRSTSPSTSSPSRPTRRRSTKFGIDAKNMFAFWDWVGGRYSLWSAIGLPIAVCHRHGQLRGAARPAATRWTSTSAPRRWRRTCRRRSALLGVWYNDFFDAQTLAILPYDQYLHRFAAYFQQGDMESQRQERRPRRPARATTRPARSSGASPARTASTPSTSSSTRARSSSPATSSPRSRPTTRSANTTPILLSNFFAQTEALMKGKTPTRCARS